MARQAESKVAGFALFSHHFALRQLAGIFHITYEQAKQLAHDEAMFAQLADQKKALYLSHFQRLSQPAPKP